jgi:lysophospholipid acyltransferase (LPLAT)-like uncharacterized protein
VSIFSKFGISPKVVTGMLAHLLRGYRCLLRVRTVDLQGALGAEHAPAIYAIWHNRFFLLPVLVPPEKRPQTAILVSQSRDGGYIASFLEAFNFSVIRGSSSKGGMRAMIQLKRHLAKGGSVAITPDGPRGPVYTVQPGIAWLAEKSGVPVVPVSVNAGRAIKLRSWDRTQIPLPFTRVVFRLGKSLVVSPDQETDSAESIRKALMDITQD